MNPHELTARQTAVLDLMCEGLHNKEIARRLDISPRTVEIHRAKAMRVIGARTSANAVHIWLTRRHELAAAQADAPDPRRPAAALLNERPMFKVWHDGLTITRNGDYFAHCATPEIAHALALSLDSAQLLFDPAVPADIQDDIAATLWPDTRQTTPSPSPPRAAQPLETLLAQPWEA